MTKLLPSINRIAFFVPLLALVGLIDGQIPASHAREAKRPTRERIESQLKETLIPVREVEFYGITALDQTTLETALEQQIGEPLERSRVVRTAENIQALYQARGYEQIQVLSELRTEKGPDGKLQGILSFTVREGAPVRVADVDLTVTPRMDPSLQAALIARTEIVAGEPLSQEKLREARRLLQDALASNSFIGATVQEPVAHSFKGDIKKLLPEFAEPVSRWVRVEFRLDLGDRVTFGFRGNKVFSHSRLNTLVEEQRLLGFGKDYVQAIRNRIIEEYQAAGFAHAEVTPFTFEVSSKGSPELGRPRGSMLSVHERHVTYQISEGPRVRISSIGFEGNIAFDSDTLLEQFYDRGSRLIQRDIFVQKDLEKASELLVEWMKSQGYLSSKLVAINRFFEKYGREEKGRARVVIYLYEGEQTRVRKIDLLGFSILDKSDALEMLSLDANEPLDLFAFSEGIEEIKAYYRARGFLDAQFTNENSETVVRYALDNRVADIRLELQEGHQYRVSRIDVQGNVETSADVIRRELELEPGDILEERLLTESESRIRRLGIFANVRTSLVDEPGRPGFKRIIVSVQEGLPGVYAYGGGFRSDLGFRVFGQYSYANVWKRNHTISASLTGNRRLDENFCDNTNDESTAQIGGSPSCFPEGQLQISYLWPWFILGPTHLRPSLTIEQTQYRLLDARTISFSTNLERSLWERIGLSGVLSMSVESVRQFHAQVEEDNRQLVIASLTPSIQLDLRDNSLAPTRGLFISSSLEYAPPGLFSQSSPLGTGGDVPVGYSRFQLRADGFIPLIRNSTWYVSFRTGFARNLVVPPSDDPENKNYALPLIKHFALGGAGSIRGFKEQELNHRDLAIRGTLAYVNYRTQLDVPFAGALRFGPFLDAANLLVDDFSLGRLRYGAGFGFHYLSPVGPVNFDIGFKLDPRPDEDRHRFYFSIGVL